MNCATYNNTSGASSGVFTTNTGSITGSGSFFVNAAGGDFSLNNTASAGALLRGAALPQLFPVITTASHADIGAAQSGLGGSTGSASSVPFVGLIT